MVPDGLENGERQQGNHTGGEIEHILRAPDEDEDVHTSTLSCPALPVHAVDLSTCPRNTGGVEVGGVGVELHGEQNDDGGEQVTLDRRRDRRQWNMQLVLVLDLDD